MDFNERIVQFNEMIAGARSIAFFTGAGISTGSGIPDFRSANGLYNTVGGIKVASPEYMLSDGCLRDHPDAFFKYLRDNMDFREAEPNIAHQKISELQLTRDVSVITQNIDGLHEKANSEKVHAIHGTMARYVCTDCQCDEYVPEDVLDGAFDDDSGVPKCFRCGEGIVRPDIVLYGEGMAYPAWQDAQSAAMKCDLMIVVGTSLTVYPAAYIPMNCYGKKMVIINRDETSLDSMADLIFHEDIRDVFERVIVPKE
jgi:NAD-dependent deacetylase